MSKFKKLHIGATPKIAKFTFFDKYRNFRPSLQPNQKCNDQMAWYNYLSIYSEATTKRACPLEVRYGLHDEPKSRVSGPGLSKISKKKLIFFLKPTQNHLKRTVNHFFREK